MALAVRPVRVQHQAWAWPAGALPHFVVYLGWKQVSILESRPPKSVTFIIQTISNPTSED